MIRRTIAAAALGMTLLAPEAEAQVTRPLGGPRVGLQSGGPPQRARLEQRFRQRMWAIARARVGLTDDQMARLQATTERFDPRRRALVAEERARRTILRREILADTVADQARISGALDRLLQLQRARLDLQVEEQRELAGFMTPIQRARYAALQEQLRRRADALRRQRADSATMPGPR